MQVCRVQGRVTVCDPGKICVSCAVTIKTCHTLRNVCKLSFECCAVVTQQTHLKMILQVVGMLCVFLQANSEVCKSNK